MIKILVIIFLVLACFIAICGTVFLILDRIVIPIKNRYYMKKLYKLLNSYTNNAGLHPPGEDCASSFNPITYAEIKKDINPHDVNCNDLGCINIDECIDMCEGCKYENDQLGKCKDCDLPGTMKETNQ